MEDSFSGRSSCVGEVSPSNIGSDVLDTESEILCFSEGDWRLGGLSGNILEYCSQKNGP